MKVKVTSEGDKQLAELLAVLGSQKTVKGMCFTAIAAGLNTLRWAAVKESPGLVKREWGIVLSDRGNGAVGYAGLGTGGYRASVERPHGKYLEFGTPYIPARHFGQTAMLAAVPKAAAAMRRAIVKRVNKLANHSNQGT